jgi:hypothetical protein
LNVRHNHQRRLALIWIGVMLVGLIFIFVPRLAGMNGSSGGFALSFSAGFVALVGLIAAFIYFTLAKSVDRITQKEKVLAHWQFKSEEWQGYERSEHHDVIGGRWNLFILAVAITLIIGVVFWAIRRDHFLTITLICLGVIAVSALITWVTIIAGRRSLKAVAGEVFIALDGAYINRQLHIWKGQGARLEEIVFETPGDQPRIRAEYTAPSRENRNSYTAHIPVPSGQEEEARQIVAKIATDNPGASQSSRDAS